MTLAVIIYIASYALSFWLQQWEWRRKNAVTRGDVIVFAMFSLLGPIMVFLMLVIIVGQKVRSPLKTDRVVWERHDDA